MKTEGMPLHHVKIRGNPGSLSPRGRSWPWFAQLAWCALALCVLGLLTFQVRQTFADAHTVCAGIGCAPAQLTRPQLHLLQRAGISLDAYGVYAAAVIVIFACVYSVVAGVIIWRKPSDRMAVITAFTLLLFGGLVFDSPIRPQPGLPGTLWLPEDVLGLLGSYAMYLFFLLFPNGRLALRWPIVLFLPLAVFQAGEVIARHSSLDTGTVPLLLNGASWILMFGAVIYLQIYRYRHVSSPVERQQTKVVVFGSVAAMISLAGTFTVYPLASMTGNALFGLAAFPATHAAGLLIPLSIGVAIMRYRLYDIDVLINRTLVYGSLSSSLAAIYIACVISLQALFRVITGQSSELAVTISTLAVAALFQPLRRRIQTFIDRRFYRRKYDAEQTLAAFGTRLRNEVDLDQVTRDLLGVVQETVQPAHVSLWLRSGDTRT